MKNRHINPSEKKQMKKHRSKHCCPEYQETRTIIVPECMEGVSKLIFAPRTNCFSESSERLSSSDEILKGKRRKKRGFKKHLSQMTKTMNTQFKEKMPLKPFCAESEPLKTFRDNDPKEKIQRRRQIDPTTCERDYSAEEIEFMNALDQYKRANGRMFPTCSEILEVIKSLGYVKTQNQPEKTVPIPIKETTRNLSSPKIKPTIPFLSTMEIDKSSIEYEDYDAFYEYREPLMIY